MEALASHHILFPGIAAAIVINILIGIALAGSNRLSTALSFLAIVGTAMLIGSLLLPWYEIGKINPAPPEVQTFVKKMMTTFGLFQFAVPIFAICLRHPPDRQQPL